MKQNDFTALFTDTDSIAVLELVFNTCYDSVVITKAHPNDHEIVYANPQFCRMTGYALQELRGQTTRMLKGPKTNPGVIARLKQNLKDGLPFKGSAVNYRKNKTEYQVEWNIHHILDKHGKPKYYISIQRDLSSLKDTLSRLKNTNDQFRQFLKGLTETKDKGEQATLKAEVSERLTDNAGLFSPALRREERIEFFDESELFGFEAGEKGVFPVEEKKSFISAKEYAEKVALSDFEIQTISSIIKDLCTTVDLLSLEKGRSEAISTLSLDFQELANNIFFIEEFVEMASVLSSLSVKLKNQLERDPQIVFPEFVVFVFESLVTELRNWFDSVFIQQESGNIHAEDASIIGSAKQLLHFLDSV